MTTYNQIQEYVKKNYFFIPKSCWIAHMKEICKLPVRKAHNRVNGRKHPCPIRRRQDIKNAFKHFKMI